MLIINVLVMETWQRGDYGRVLLKSLNTHQIYAGRVSRKTLNIIWTQAKSVILDSPENTDITLSLLSVWLHFIGPFSEAISCCD